MKAVVVQVTESIVMQMDENMDTRWKAKCPLCRWSKYAQQRTEVERLLHNHFGTHNADQGVMDL